MASRAFVVLACLVALSAPGPLAAQNLVRDTRRSCESGEIATCTVLGLIYETGAAGERDVARALELYQRACDAGRAEGCTRVALAQTTAGDTIRADTSMRWGHIADAETGAPIGEAVVEIPSLGIRVLADEAGRVALGPLPRGRHEVFAGRLGYVRLSGVLPVPYDTDFLMLLESNVMSEEGTVGRIVGRVVDEATGQGMPNVDITLGGEEPRNYVSGSDGRFAIPGIDPGSFDLTFEHIGYGTRTTSVAVAAGVVVEVRASLSMQPIELDPIEVRVGSRYLDRSGYYRRSVLSIGTQYSRSEIADMHPVTMSDIILRAPGITTENQRGRTVIFSTRSGDRMGAAACRVRTYLDGLAMHDWDLEFLRPDDVEGIEIYHGASTPIEYQYLVDPDGVYPCGVVLIWTRRND
ncbi:MAG: carboxypeptidase regulatory-like domain-containing protein [Gemmatimonadales bacterium]